VDETILVVDDDPAMRELLGDGLAQRGYRVLTAPDGHEGLRLARSERPALVISDVIMPGMNGWEFCRQVRADPALAKVPFLFLSSVSESADRAIGLELGADDYVGKPVDLRELELRILRALRGTAQGAAPTLSGELRRMPLPDLLQLLASQGQTGILRLATIWGEGEIVFRQGRILAASLGGLRGLMALNRLVFLEDGRFGFDPVQIYIRDEVGLSVQEIILEVARLRDESGTRGTDERRKP
jgi:DNA-binding response OmpR family regulator